VAREVRMDQPYGDGNQLVAEEDDLSNMGVRLVEQSSLEHSIQVNAARLYKEKEVKGDQKRLEKSTQLVNKIRHEIRKLEDRLMNPRTKISQKEELKEQIRLMKEDQLEPAKQDIKDINERLRTNMSAVTCDDFYDDGRLPNESEKDFLIRTGKITAFGNSTGFVIEEDEEEENGPVSHQNLRVPGFTGVSRVINKRPVDESGEEYIDSSQTETDEDIQVKRPKLLTDDEIRNIDDGVESFYQDRLNTWVYKRSRLRGEDSMNDTPEWRKPHPTHPDASLNHDFKIPGDIYPSLFDYQKTGVQWLYELFQQEHGGIISDEMGLGKTIQIIAFVAGLHYSGMLDRPVLIVCPATVMTQWVNEFHTWWPPLRTMVLHSIGSGMSGKNGRKEEDFEKMIMMEDEEDKGIRQSINSLKNASNAKAIVQKLIDQGHVLITSYVGLRIYEEQLLNINWGYVVLDEGHKIKNPNSNITILSKRLKTHNRVILSGTPIQNNLIELWSLFDFIFPGRLGTLPIFQEEFETPIKQGGYANASNLEVKIGYQKAVILKDLIQPFLLRRMKVDVARDLPSKQEYVLMCRLTQYQREKYIEFLRSTEFKVNSYLGAIDLLRKICNHPDLAEARYTDGMPGYGDPARSGKLQVVKSLLPLWKQQGHKVLLFTQTKQMMVILEKFLQKSMGPGYRYMKMSGETGIGKRQDMIYSFNNEDYDLFLLTTKVGGLGVNLTGADRVIIFDPDWNPSTDLQARERAWRLGQKKEVLIYRLVIGGSIEEKIYHRQIFKQLLTDKILKDPNQKRFFKNSELHDLFTLSDFEEGNSGTLFKQAKKGGDDLGNITKIAGVSKLETYKEQTISETEDDRLMGGLFNNNSVAQALKHDEVVGQHSRPDDDILEREARKSATEALEALRKSRKQVKKAGVGVPTFTGKVGLAGKKATLSRNRLGGQSSSSILANLKKVNSSTTVEASSSTKMIGDMRSYLMKQDGFVAKSGDILKACGLEIKDKKDLTMVRSMLKGIAKWDSESSGWVLNEEFRDD
jgi:DNA excision repair protein ERCC-6